MKYTGEILPYLIMLAVVAFCLHIGFQNQIHTPSNGVTKERR